MLFCSVFWYNDAAMSATAQTQAVVPTINGAYRFLIIDDEPIVREGISEIIDWHSHGFELVGACRDGREGIRAIEELLPDVVLTDICMPFVDGLQLAAWVAEQYPAVKTILLTGYDDFEYAQEAVKLRVTDFLLKPITADELREMLEKIRRELDIERSQERRLKLLQQQVHESLPLLRERFLNRLVRAELHPSEVQRRLDFLELVLPGPAYLALICDLDGSEDPEQLLGLAVQNIVTQVATGFPGAVAFSTPGEQSVVVLSAGDEAATLSRGLECAELIAERVSRELARTVSIGVGEPGSGFAAVPASYAQATTALEQRLVRGPAQIITAEQLGAPLRPSVQSPDSDARVAYVRAVKTADRVAAAAALDAVVGALRRSDADTETRYLTMQRLLADALSGLETLGLDALGFDPLGLDGSAPDGGQGNPFVAIARMKTLDEIQEWFRRFQERAWTVLNQRQRSHSHAKAEAAEEYIRANAHRPDLSLSAVCGALSVSKSYFSPLFKEHTGKTFVEYLTDLRVERAKELLLRDPLKSYEVAERVGFRDAHYFSLTFKKTTGVSPTEFRELARQKS